MRFQLFLDTHNEELFSKATSELGTIFFRCINPEKNTYEMVYFSGSRIARFRGTPQKKLLNLCAACGFEVDIIEIDEARGTLKIIEKE